MTGFMDLENLEEMEQRLEEIIQRRIPMVTTNDIALIAGKRFDIDKERALMQKATFTRCACRHCRPLSNGICTYRNCRHGKTHFVGVNI